ncbi:MAG: twin-arginine translocase TatA/TatE family subunit [Myxococcota bacterium]
MIFGLGPGELAVVAGVLLFVAGPALLPRLGRRVGRSLSELKSSTVGFGDIVRKGMTEEAAAPLETVDADLGARSPSSRD